MVKRYDDGVAWSMYCGAVRYGSLLLFGFVNSKLIDKFGHKWNTFFGYLCLTISDILFFFVRNKYAFLFIAILLGISFGVALTAPEAIISMITTIYKQNMYLLWSFHDGCSDWRTDFEFRSWVWIIIYMDR